MGNGGSTYCVTNRNKHYNVREGQRCAGRSWEWYWENNDINRDRIYKLVVCTYGSEQGEYKIVFIAEGITRSVGVW